MSVAKRIIPCLDVDKGRVVKGVNFVDIIDAGGPVEIARAYDQEGADEITFLDITASHEGRKNIISVVESVANEVFIPLTVGGGVKNFIDVRDLLSAGADKITINTAAVMNPDLINQVTDKIGRQCIVVAVDVKKIDEDQNLFLELRQRAPSMRTMPVIFRNDQLVGGYQDLFQYLETQ